MLLSNKNQLGDERGIALILSIIILTNLLMITLIVTDVILRIGRSSQQISESEQAYFAAEAGIENGLYQIEKNNDASGLGTPTSPISGNLDEVDANWESYVAPVYTTPVTCVDHNNKVSYHPVNSFSELLSDIGASVMSNEISCIYAEDFASDLIIRHNNSLMVLLEPGKSFELDLDLAVVDPNFYPNQLDIEWGKPVIPFKQSGATSIDGKIIVLDNGSQTIIDTNNPGTETLPASGQFGSTPHHRIRIINDEASDYGLYTFTPNGGTDNKYLPIGVRLTATGYYTSSKKKERIIQVERKNWQIY